MARTTKTVEQRRQEILSAARRLFTSNGYKNTSVADIANELGVAQGLIFHYFKTKATLLYEVFDEIAAEEQAALEEFIQKQSGLAIDCLELLFKDSSHYEQYETLINDLRDDPAVFEYLEGKINMKTVPLAERLIKRGNSDGSWYCEYPQQTALFIIQGFHAIMRDVRESGGDIEKLREAVRSILLQTLGVGNDRPLNPKPPRQPSN